MFKEAKYGAVLIEPGTPHGHSSLRDAESACPYGAIVFEFGLADSDRFKVHDKNR